VIVCTAYDVLDSPARTRAPERARVRVGLVQLAWRADEGAHDAAIGEGVAAAAAEGAQLVCLPELTRLPYVAVDPAGPRPGGVEPEPLPGGPTHALVSRLASDTNTHVHASCYERADDGRLGYNTAFVVAPGGAVVARTRKTHLPVTAGYHEDAWFRRGDSGTPVTSIGGAHFGFPTCWDQWFPELSRAFALRGADALVYPSAIGS
jgi:N-carbamoylputrescine amidase